MKIYVILQGILIGIMFGIPFGVLGAITMQRILHYGFWAGMISGMGSSTADFFYACIGVFGLTLFSDFLNRYQMIFNIIASIVLFVLGYRSITKKENITKRDNETIKHGMVYLSSFIVGITNPTAVISFLFAFSFFNISKQLSLVEGVLLATGVFIGTMIWWLILSLLVHGLKHKISMKMHQYLNIGFGMILLMVGATIMIGSIVI